MYRVAKYLATLCLFAILISPWNWIFSLFWYFFISESFASYDILFDLNLLIFFDILHRMNLLRALIYCIIWISCFLWYIAIRESLSHSDIFGCMNLSYYLIFSFEWIFPELWYIQAFESFEHCDILNDMNLSYYQG